eukprot:3252703-Amphidinium_carterae.1
MQVAVAVAATHQHDTEWFRMFHGCAVLTRSCWENGVYAHVGVLLRTEGGRNPLRAASRVCLAVLQEEHVRSGKKGASNQQLGTVGENGCRCGVAAEEHHAERFGVRQWHVVCRWPKHGVQGRQCKYLVCQALQAQLSSVDGALGSKEIEAGRLVEGLHERMGVVS